MLITKFKGYVFIYLLVLLSCHGLISIFSFIYIYIKSILVDNKLQKRHIKIKRKKNICVHIYNLTYIQRFKLHNFVFFSKIPIFIRSIFIIFFIFFFILIKHVHNFNI